MKLSLSGAHPSPEVWCRIFVSWFTGVRLQNGVRKMRHVSLRSNSIHLNSLNELNSCFVTKRFDSIEFIEWIEFMFRYEAIRFTWIHWMNWSCRGRNGLTKLAAWGSCSSTRDAVHVARPLKFVRRLNCVTRVNFGTPLNFVRRLNFVARVNSTL